MQIELIVYLLAGLLGAALGILLDGIEQGVYYAVRSRKNWESQCGENSQPKAPRFRLGRVHPKLRRFIQNVHAIQTPVSISFTLQMLALSMGVLRGAGVDFMYALPCTAGLVMGTWWIVSGHWQGWLNLGVGRPYLDPDENPQAEVSDTELWRPKLFHGRAHRVGTVVGILMVIGTLAYLVFWYPA